MGRLEVGGREQAWEGEEGVQALWDEKEKEMEEE